MRILVDQDGVIADWGHGWDHALLRRGSAAAAIPRHADQRTFNLNEGRTDAEKAIIAEIMAEPKFYAILRPIDGAKEALNAMLSAGHDVRIVTSPWVPNPTCASDKLDWVDRHYGGDWASRVIITSDKTLVRGDILVDDKPTVSGAVDPEWVHVLYSQPYNQDVDRPRIHQWNAQTIAWWIEGVLV